MVAASRLRASLRPIPLVAQIVDILLRVDPFELQEAVLGLVCRINDGQILGDARLSSIAAVAPRGWGNWLGRLNRGR